jgi:hypothetical protein
MQRRNRATKEPGDGGIQPNALESKAAYLCALHRDALGAFQRVDHNLFHDDVSGGQGAQSRHKEARKQRSNGRQGTGADRPRPQARERQPLHVQTTTCGPQSHELC